METLKHAKMTSTEELKQAMVKVFELAEMMEEEGELSETLFDEITDLTDEIERLN